MALSPSQESTSPSMVHRVEFFLLISSRYNPVHDAQFRHILRLSVLVISAEINGIQMGENSKLGWLIELPVWEPPTKQFYPKCQSPRVLPSSQSTWRIAAPTALDRTRLAGRE
jgi:hypothetical protein